MFINKKLLGICLILFFISIAGASASELNQTTDTIAVSDNGEDVLAANAGTFTELQSIIDGNESGATITLDRDYALDEIYDGCRTFTQQSGILINKPLTIDGAGFTIDGKNNARIFNITSSDVTLKNIKLINGNFSWYSVSLSNNRGPCYGGAVFVAQNLENFSFENVIFENNSIFGDISPGSKSYKGYGGAIYFGVNVKNVTFDKSSFINNNVYSGDAYGASVYFDEGASDVLFKDMIFNNNTVLHDTGHLMNSKYAAGSGAAAYIGKNSANVTFLNGEIFNNSVINVNDYPGQYDFYGNDAIYVAENAEVTVENYSLNHSGFTAIGNLTVKNVNFTNISSIYSSGNLYLDNCLFRDGRDEAGNGGGAIYISKGTAVIKNSEFTNNTANSYNGVMYSSQMSGGAIYASSGEVFIDNSTFRNNRGERYGGAIYSSAHLTLINSTFEDNYIKNIMTGEGSGHGGAVYLKNSNNEVRDCNFTNNTAYSGSGGALAFASYGNIVDNCNFTGNLATYFYYDPQYEYSWYVSNNGKGGAIFFNYYYGTQTVSNSHFENNTAHWGSAIDSYYDALSISNSTFKDNKLDNLIVDIYAVDATMRAEVYLTAGNTQISAIHSEDDLVAYDNVIFYDAGGKHNTDSDPHEYMWSIPNQDVTLEVWKDGVLYYNKTKLTNEYGMANFNDLGLENDDYNITAYHKENEYYVYGNATGKFKKLGDFTLLQGLIYDTPANGTLNLTRNYTYTVGLDDFPYGISIGKNITINGNGYTVDALGQCRIFSLYPYTYMDYIPGWGYDDINAPTIIKLNNITFANGNCIYDNGGAIASYWTNLTVEIDGCKFINNTAEYGTAIYISGDFPFTVENSYFEDNKMQDIGIDVNYRYGHGDLTVELYTSANNFMGTIYSEYPDALKLSNNSYMSDVGVISTEDYPALYSYGVPFENVTVEITKEGQLVKNITACTDASGLLSLGDLNLENGQYEVMVYHFDSNRAPYAENAFTLDLEPIGNFTKLQYMIDETPENGVLNLTQNYTFTMGLDDGMVNGIYINKNITINGNGYTLNALNQSRIFYVQYRYDYDPMSGSDILVLVHVALNNITFVNASSSNTSPRDYDGAAVYSKGAANLTIEGCTFRDITCNSLGNVVTYLGSKGTLVSSLFERNFGETIFMSYYSNVSVVDTLFINNTAAAVAFSEQFSNVIFNGTRFINNTPIYSSMYVQQSNASIVNSEFTGNTAYWVGAAIFGQLSVIDIKKTNFTNNRLNETLDLDFCMGGAIVSYYDVMTIDECVFTNNSASMGGAISTLEMSPSNLTITNSRFINNTADFGGAIYIENGPNFIINSTDFIGNSADFGGAIYMNESSNQIIAASRFINNTASLGGAVYLEGCYDITFEKSAFTNNSAVNGSAMYINGSDEVNFIGSTLLENRANSTALDLVVDDVNYKVEATFTGKDNYINALYVQNSDLIFSNVKYWGADGIVSSDDVEPFDSVYEAGQTIIFEIYYGDLLVKNISAVTDIDGKAEVYYLDLERGPYTVKAYSADDKYYTLISQDIPETIPAFELGDFARLQKMIDVTPDGKILNLTRNFTYNPELDNITEGILIRDRNISIAGNGFVIDALEKSRIFYVQNSTVRFDNVTFANGSSQTDDLNASAIYISGSEFTVTNAVFENNRNDDSIYVESGKLNMSDSVLMDANSIFNNGESYLENVIETNGDSSYAIVNNATLSLKKNEFKGVIKNNAIIVSKTNTTILDNDTIEINTDSIDLVARILDDNRNIIETDFKFVDDAAMIDSTFNGTDYTAAYSGFDLGFHLINGSAQGLENNTVYYEIFTYKKITSIELTINKTNEGEKVTINATVSPDDVEGNITFMVNNIIYSREIINGVATLELENLEPDNYNVLVTFNGDEGHKNASVNDSFEVNLRPTVITITVENSDKAVIKANLTEGATGEVKFIVDGVTYIRNVGEDLEIDKFTAGNHTIAVIYGGDDLYASCSNSTVYEVKKSDSLVAVSAKNITYGKNATITVTVPKAQKGTVTITVNDEKYTKEIKSGKAVFTVPGLAVGDYPVNVIYNGDDNYNINDNSTLFKVTKAVLDASVEALNVTTAQNASFIISVPDDFTGKVRITVDGETYDGSPDSLIQMANLTAGDKKATVKFYGDSNYKDKTLTAEFTVVQESKPVVKNASNIKVEVKDGKIIATVEKGVSGDVTFYVNGEEYTAPIKNGKATLNNALSVGNNSIVAYYPGNELFNSSVDSINYTMPKLASYVSASAEDVDYGSDVTITVVVPKAQSGTVTITVDGKTYTEKIKSGKAVFTVSGLDAKTYKVDVKYNGDDSYDTNTNTTSFKVTKAVLDASVDALDVTTEQNASFVIDVPDDFKGKVKITVDDLTYDGDVESVISMANLTAGDKKATVKFYGDSNYKDKTLTVEFSVTEVEKPVVKNASNIKVEVKDGKIVATVEKGISGDVTFYVNGKEYTAPIKNGKATINNALTVGNNSIVAYYPGNELFNSSEASITYMMDKLPSSVKASADDVAYGSDATITVEVPKAQTGTVTITVDGKTYTEKIKSGKAVFTISGLDAKTYKVDVKYNGDDIYDANTNTTSFKVTKAVLDASVDALDVTTEQNASFVIDVPDDFKGKVKITVDDLTYDGDVESVISMANLTAGDKSATVKFYGDSNYKDKTLTVEFTVSEVEKPVVKKASNIKVEVKDENIVATVENGASGDVTFYVNGKKYTAPIKNGKATLKNALSVGNNSIVAYYPENEAFDSSEASVNYVMDKLASSVKASADDVAYRSDATVSVEVPKAQTGTVTITVDGKTYTEKIKSGKATFTLSGLAAGTYKVDVRYNGDDTYDVSSNSTSFKVTKASLDACVDAVDVTTEQNASFVITVPDDFAGKVKITVDGETYDGEAKSLIQMSNLTEGDKKATVRFYNDPNYNDLSLTCEFKVSEESIPVGKKDANITVDVEGDDVSITLPSDATGNVEVSVNGKKYTVPVKDGKAVLNDLPLEAGNNTIIAIWEGDDNYNGAFADKTVEVKTNTSVVISASDVVKYFSGPERFIVNVGYDNGTGIPGIEVVITINGIDYDRATNEKGIASFPLNLNSANYTVDVRVDEYKFKSKNNVEILPTIYASDVTKVFRNGTQYYAQFVDGEGNPLVNTKVSFNIHGVFYNRTTNASGWAKLNLNLEKGTYILTAMNPVTGEMRTNIVTVISQLETKDLVKYYKNESKFVVRVVADDGSYAGAGEEVTFNIHGMIYTRVTNATGHAALNINIEPGEYTITTYYKECREGNKITVLPTLKASDLTMKYRDGSKFTANVLDGQGKPYQNQKVSFNINGVLYNRYTDSSGNAKLNINLQAGEYIITSEYNGYKISNTIKIEA